MGTLQCVFTAHAGAFQRPDKAISIQAIRSIPCLVFLSFLNSNAIAQNATSDATELDEIIVEEEGEPETPLPLGIGMSGDTLRTTPGSGGDPVRALQSLPGFIYADDEEALPAVRGSRPDDNYFQADFAPVSYLFHFDGLISVFNSDLIKSFDIYQSGYGPEFSGVTGGVFDVQLRDPQTDRFRASIDVSLLQAGLLVEGPVSETQSFYLAGRVSYLDRFLQEDGEAEEEDDDDDGIRLEQFPKYSDYQGKYVWKPSEDNRLTFQFNGASDVAELDIAEDSEEIDTDPLFAGTVLFDELFHEQTLVWDHSVNQKLSVKTLISHSYYEERGLLGGVGSYDISDERILLKSHASYILNDQHDLGAGLQVLQGTVDVDATLALPPCGELDVECISTGAERLSTTETIDSVGTRAFVKDNWYVTDRLTLYPGIAFQHEDYLDKHFVEPRFAAEYTLSENTILSAGIGQYQQAPGFIESNKVFGNPELDYANALHAQLGLQRYFGNSWEIKSEVFYKSLDNLVTSDSVTNFSNDGDGYAYGLDTLIRKNLTDKISGWAAVSLSTARRRDKRTGETFVFDYDQPVNVSLVGNYKFNKKWSIGAKLWAHSGAPFTPVVGAVEDAARPGFYRPSYGTLNSDRFSTYHRVDLRIDRTFKRKNDNTMGLYFELFNILGTKNALEYNYNADYTEKELETQITDDFSFGFKATF